MTDAAAAVAAVRHALAATAPDGAGMVLAVSGGADSAGMAHLVAQARGDLRLHVVHVRHGLRDDAADAAAAMAHADALGVAGQVVAVRVEPQGRGPEAAAREARYDALTAAAGRLGAACVATGHTADDQAETVLLNLARGAGTGGLAGIPASRRLAGGVTLVRPVLTLRRAQVRAVAAATGLPTVEDPTNTALDQPRATARGELLPLLSRLTGGGSDPVAALTRVAAHARSDAAALDTIAAAVAQDLVRTWGGVVTVPARPLGELPVAVAARVVRSMLAGLEIPAPQRAVQGVLGLADGQAVTLPGGAVGSRGGGLVALAARAERLVARPVGPGVTPVPEIGLALRCSTEPAAGVVPPWAPARAVVGARIATPDDVVVRARQPGDRVRTAAGTQLLSDAMSDAGVPRVARDRLPVVADGRGVVWVPGVAVRIGAEGPWHLGFEPVADQ